MRDEWLYLFTRSLFTHFKSHRTFTEMGLLSPLSLSSSSFIYKYQVHDFLETNKVCILKYVSSISSLASPLPSQPHPSHDVTLIGRQSEMRCRHLHSVGIKSPGTEVSHFLELSLKTI